MGKKMSSPSLTESQFIRICRLINDSLHPFTVSENLSFSKQEEKNLLLILSQVSNETRRLIPSADTSSPLNPNSQNHHCLSKSISHLIPLLNLESLYIQHLAGNVLVTFSEFLASSVKTWEFFIHSLSICLELSISNISSCSFEPSITGAGGSGSDLLNLVGLFKPKLKNTSLFTVAGIIRTLRNILKFLKEECDDELVLVLLNSISFFISNVPWDSMDEIFGGNGGEDDERNALFLGNFIQLLSSFVDQISFAEGLDDSLDKNVILSKIINLVPKLLYWSLRKEGKCVNTCISRYFSHKLLVLMIRLSLQIPLDFLVLVSWLQLLHSYFEDLLYQPLTDVMNQDDYLEDSPFMLSNFDGEVHSMHSRHLQRQAIFLFLRCSFSLINLGKATRKHYSSATVKSSIDVDAISEQSCGREKGLLEIYAWLSGHVVVDKLVAHEMYREKSINFSFSLLKLYTHEDDILFKFLLELLSLQACEEQKFHKERLAPQDEMEDVLFHVSYIFNPIRLFHLFLAELHYDHQVLLDYLISKDTGISCAEYLLRCLRIVCDSWQTFMEFSVYGKLSNQLSSKRRKILSESSNFKIEPSSGPVKTIPLSLEKKFNGNLEYRHMKQMYELAKGCLLSLKKSVENLHLKNLFPYNPEVLLKRLERFQELCFKQ
ncbi:uncharacterized protein LOC105763330 [Gossypium raimondii]|uniref:Protein Lines C-terminal domain-containing protein n=1 Tax=Gossypium raimondii TaxID=29730 RepID=A0A0D2SWL0_GOSRA|nr:uncharacterized protein LOC105763330 [Gossypium raimondii]KJB48502.1 hypothetical protein B456_008G072600 [Gossypium raimondii]KJB48503.1 hypothetical protein B456_008G072600 [Gossypium raimondii]KJB48504.1 hypothetical protein B456_008G072600 [Gossypium raimondii]